MRASARAGAPERRADLLVRYLGFPFWDVLLYPIQAVADAGERDTIEVVRMSPHDATLLDLPDRRSRSSPGSRSCTSARSSTGPGRENDYLWGRLDGAERLIGLLLGDDLRRGGAADWCRKAFAAIVEEEGDVLTNATALLEKAKSF